MSNLLFTAIAFLAYQSDSTPPLEPDWSVHISNLTVPDPTRPDSEPELGYAGLWRAIYGDRDETDLTPGGFTAQPFAIDSSEDEVARRRRAPRIRSARWLALEQPFYNRPSFDVPRSSLSAETADFIWDHQLQQVSTPWNANAYSMAPTSTPRDYMPNSIQTEEERADWTEDAGASNLLFTVAVAVLAVVLLVVIMFMPK
ncbi:MAG: hypothetical protein AB8G99_01245 [Planctomycetaceae bacterium]